MERARAAAASRSRARPTTSSSSWCRTTSRSTRTASPSSRACAPCSTRFAGLLAGDRDAQLTVVGHTDSTGSETFNNALSLDRAQSVRDYLVGRGVPATQIRPSGRGPREPIADNASDAARARNRRIEIFVPSRARRPERRRAACR